MKYEYEIETQSMCGWSVYIRLKRKTKGEIWPTHSSWKNVRRNLSEEECKRVELALKGITFSDDEIHRLKTINALAAEMYETILEMVEELMEDDDRWEAIQILTLVKSPPNNISHSVVANIDYLLHRITCSFSHTDGCSYFENWRREMPTDKAKEWLSRLRKRKAAKTEEKGEGK